MPKQISQQDAKQGRSGKHVLYILVAALILAAVAWVIAEGFGEATEPTNPCQPEQTQPAPERPAG